MNRADKAAGLTILTLLFASGVVAVNQGAVVQRSSILLRLCFRLGRCTGHRNLASSIRLTQKTRQETI